MVVNLRHIVRARTPLLTITALVLVACNASDPPLIAPTPFAGAEDLSTTRVRGGDNGLEVVHWSAPCSSLHAAETLAKHGQGGTLPPETIDRLRRNGFVVAEIPTETLPKVLADLGGTLSDVRNWHGQVPEWRELLRVGVGPGVAVYTGERVASVGGGAIRMSMRGWTVPMEDGGLFWLEMIPHAVTNESAAATALSSRDRLRGDAFADAGFSVVLDRGWSLLISPEPVAPVSARTTGPDADPPSTLGSLLLPCEDLPSVSDGFFQQRTPVIVLIARLPDSLVPQPEPRAGGGS